MDCTYSEFQVNVFSNNRYYKMSKFSHNDDYDDDADDDDNDDDKAIAILRVFFFPKTAKLKYGKSSSAQYSK